MLQLKQKNLRSLNDLNKMIDDINHLDSKFNTMKDDTEMIMEEAKENYFSTLNNFEVLTTNSFISNAKIFILNVCFRNCY